ncbi:MAG: rod shape-determining protein MreC [Methylacidiphilales bacterium]|nr:rod shape-determining protein MreC [Candidatus Methylacidiphilales bacterium]
MKKSTYQLLLLGFICALLLSCFLLPEQFSQDLRIGTKRLFGPVLRLAEKPVHFFTHMDARLKTLDQAQVEAASLRRQIAELQLQNQLLTNKAAENARLREMLGYRDASQYRLRACQVISREPSNWWVSVQVNVGWQDEPDLKPDQPVVSPRGVVGKTGIVTRYITDVILMVDKNCSISALVENPQDPGAPTDLSGNHDHGIVQGEGNFEEGTPLVKILYLPKDSQVQVGQFVVTSGLGPYFPAGLRLGTIKEVPPLTKTYPTFGLYREAVVEPTADLNHLDELFIVLGPKQDNDSKPPQDSDNKPSP